MRHVLLIALTAALAVRPAPVWAHAIVVAAEPAHDAVLQRPPSRVLLRFNSRIEHRFTRVTLTGPGGRAVPLPAVAPDQGADRLVVALPALAPGLYVLRFRVLAADGHLTESALRFRVQEGAGR